jgi:hypothetical protein
MPAKPAPNLAPRLVNREAGAAYCGISAPTFDGQIRPHLREIRIGNRVLFDVRDIDALIDGWSSVGQAATHGWMLLRDPPNKRRRARPG